MAKAHLALVLTCGLVVGALSVGRGETLTWRFDRAGEFNGWRADGFREIHATADGIRGVTDRLPALTSPNLAIAAGKYRAFVFRAASDTDGPGRLYFAGPGEQLAEEREVEFRISGDGLMHDYAVDLGVCRTWRGTIEQVRFDPIYAVGAKVRITEIAFEPEVGPPGRRYLALSIGRQRLKTGEWVRYHVPFDYTGIYAIQLSYRAPASAKLEVGIRFTDILDQALPEKLYYALKPDAGAGRLDTTFLLPKLAAAGELKLRLVSRTPGQLAPVDDLTIRRAAADQPEPLPQRPPPMLPPGHVPKTEFDLSNAAPALLIDGHRFDTMNYLIDETKAPGLIENCRANGIHLYWLNISDTPWKPPNEFDFSKVDERCESLLAQDPDAQIVFLLALDNQINPGLKAWVESYPDELVRTSDGSPEIPDYGGYPSKAPSMASQAWQQMAEVLLRGLGKHVREARYGSRVIGYMPGFGVTFEWQQWASVAWPAVFVDYSEPARRAFIDWTKREYRDLAELNASWKTDYSTFEDIAIPTKDERCRSDLFSFLDPTKSQREIDFRRHYAELVADVICRLARAVKDESGGRSLYGVFYGYVTHILGPYRYHLSGHCALAKVLDSPDVDFLMSPSSYSDREIGGASGFMSANDSVRLRGKIWFDQADIRTHHSSLSMRVATLADAKASIIRHFAHALVSGCAEQWYDFSTGWISGDARLMQLVGKLNQIEQRVARIKRSACSPANSIGVIVDERSTDYTALSSWLHHDTVIPEHLALTRSGVGFDTYLIDDLDRMPDYKCYLFLNTFRITPQQKKLIESKLKRAGKVLVFVAAPGVTDGERLVPERVAEITGIKMEVLQREFCPRTKLVDAGHPALEYAKPGSVYGCGGVFGPVFIPREGDVLGFIESESQLPGLAVKRSADWTCIFSSAPSLSAQLVRGIAEYAGIRIANAADNDVTFVGDRLIAVHTVRGGPRTLQCGPRSRLLEDMLTGKKYPVRDGAASVRLAPRSTSVFIALGSGS